MLENYMTNGINEHYLPILDKNSHHRLIDGYSVCDGAADTYIRIGEFLNLKGYVVILFNENYSAGPHTITLMTPEKSSGSSIEYLRDNALVIDPLYDITFKKGQETATLNNICNGDYNKNQKEYLKKQDYSLEKFFCFTKDIWIRNEPLSNSRFIKRFYYSFLDLTPEFILFKLHTIYINQLYNENEFFLKARNYDLFGNSKLARKYYNLSITNKINENFDIFRGANKDGNYEYKKSINKPVDLENYANFFLTLLENKEKNIIQKNHFLQSSVEGKVNPFYKLYENYYHQKINHLEYIYF